MVCAPDSVSSSRVSGSGRVRDVVILGRSL